MSQRLNNLNEIIAVLKSGADFYRKAARQADGDERARIFEDHAALRETTARHLSDIVEDVGGEVKERSVAEEVRKVATQTGAAIVDTDARLVDGLEEHEDRTLAAFRNAVLHPDNARDEAMLKDFMQKFEESHERMRTLQEQT